jgi:DNA-binding Lrp family transcriptional regulator
MPKKTHHQLVLDEKKVLSLLRTQGKDSIDDIARHCNFSRQKVLRIIKKLENEKIIWGYSAICDDEATQYKHYMMLMKRSVTPLDQTVLNEVINTKLDDLLPKGIIEIENIDYVHGLFDGVVTFRTDGIVNAKKFCERFNEHLQGFVADIQLLETIVPIRKQGMKNPNIKKQIQFL